MKTVLISMPDITPIVIHEQALHMPALGIASLAGNIDRDHQVYVIDLIRKRTGVRRYLERTMKKIRPDIVGLSAMTWQFETCMKIARLLKGLLPTVKIVLGGYHVTLLYDEIAGSDDAGDIDFMIRGEGEEAFRRLLNSLEGRDSLSEIPSLSYKENGLFVHNERGPNLDLAGLDIPVRDKRRLTGGYHTMFSRIEVMETSRGCTRECNFCSIRHMYGRSFRTYPLERIIRDIDDIYYNRKTRWIFIADDNMVLNPRRVMEVCDAIIARGYKGLKIVVQADCVSMARNEDMVRKMSQAGFRTVFLGIENGSKKNLAAMNKGNILEEAGKAVENCHKYGLMVIGGLIFGLPDDTEQEIIENYEFFKSLQADASYVQLITPYPSTKMREEMLREGLVTNPGDYRWYSGLWANVRTRHLSPADLQYYFWLHRQVTLGWWKPSPFAVKKAGTWVTMWKYFFKPLIKFFYERRMNRIGLRGMFEDELKHLEDMNAFPDLDEFSRNTGPRKRPF